MEIRPSKLTLHTIYGIIKGAERADLMNKSTKIEWKPIDELIPYEHNAKKHTKKQIANLKTSFEKFGWQNPVLIDENNVIICGHGRILGAREAGISEAPCIVCKDLSEDEIRDYRHLDNLLSEGDYIQDEFDIDLPDLSDFDFSEIDINLFEETPLIENLDGGEIKDNSKSFVAVKIVFENVKQWKKYEDDLRKHIDNYENVTVSVGAMSDEN